MKSHLPERIYLSSPVWLQNILVSIYGMLEHRRRYGGEHKALSQKLANNEKKDWDAIHAEVTERLEEILRMASQNVPHYRSLKLTTQRLEDFPVLERQTIADAPELLLNCKVDPKELLALYTGGSSANPLKVYITKSIRQRSYAFWDRFYARMGFKIGEKKASFVGRKLQNPDDDTPPFWRYNLIDKQMLFSSYHMSEKNIPSYINKLNRFKPKVIEGYPLSIYRIAEYIVRNSIRLNFTPVGISTSSENFTKKQREIMELAFGCKVYDQYGSAESVVFASECEHGTMHIEPEYGVVEIMKKDGTISKEGEGELIVTTLLNDAMPLIRYRIGDLGIVEKRSCPCGRDTMVLSELQGKVGAVIVNGDKTVPTAAIAIAFEYLEGVKNAQIIQDSPNEVTVKLVKKSDYNPESESFMIWELQKMIGKEITIKIEHVEEILGGKNGKYAMVVQNYYNF